MTLLLALAAWGAEPCADLAERLQTAWAAFDDAEVAETERVLDLAITELGCQSRPLGTDELFELFALDATASLATDDQDGAVYAAIRAVTVAPERAVDDRYGPDVASLFDTWRRRLAAAELHVIVEGPVDLRIDGHPVPPGTTWAGVEGEHVLQWASRDVWHTEVRELQGWFEVHTGKDTIKGVDAPVVEPMVAEQVDAPVAPLEAPQRRRGVGTPAVWGTGIALALLGGGAVVAGWQVGERFEANPYDGTYDGLSQGERGYRDARDAQIDHDALLIRTMLGGGYGLIGAGALMFGVGLGVQPQGASLTVTLPIR
jgi:hypothetical protein